MTDFKHGEIVRFKGDDVDYRVDYENIDYDDKYDTVDLIDLDRKYNTIEFVPTRLLERAPTPLSAGDIVKDAEEGIYIFGGNGKVYEEVHTFLNKDTRASDWAGYEAFELAGPLVKIGYLNITDVLK